MDSGSSVNQPIMTNSSECSNEDPIVDEFGGIADAAISLGDGLTRLAKMLDVDLSDLIDLPTSSQI